MFFSSRVPLSALVTLCQAFRVGLSAGLPLVKVVQQQARRGPFASRAVLERIGDRLEKGDSLEDVLKDEGKAFPPLFNGMVAVGEQAGGLPEVFKELERYYREQITLRRRFWTLAAWPIFEFCAAVFVIVMLLLILDWLGATLDPIGLGIGPVGAFRFLVLVGMLVGAVIGAYLLVTRVLGQKATVHRVLLYIPGIGGCLHAMALTRFCLGMHLAMKTSLPVGKALKKCLRATGNGAYEACADRVTGSLKRGKDVTETLTACKVFPEEFLQVVATAEESGQLPEVMGRQAEQYQEIASMRLNVLTTIGNVCFLLFMLGLLGFMVIRMAMEVYIKPINDLAGP